MLIYCLDLPTSKHVTLGVGYHSWIVATEDEDILLQGGGPDDGDLFLMQSYRSELGGVAAKLAVLGTLIRSGLINIASMTFLCDNASAILSANRPLTDSIFHRIEGYHDLVSTIKDLQENWCRGMDITYEWAKEHADDLNQENWCCGMDITYEWVNGHADDLNRELTRATQCDSRQTM
jgi:hypothetical protein